MLFAKVGVVASNPVFSGGSEDVGGFGVFESFNHVGGLGGDDEAVAGADYGAFAGHFEAECAGGHHGHLFVLVMVKRNDGALLQNELRDGEPGGVDDLATHQRI